MEAPITPRSLYRAKPSRAKPGLHSRSWRHERFFLPILLQRASSTSPSVAQKEIDHDTQVQNAWGDQHINLSIAVILIVLAGVLRLLPHAPNFAPIAAIAIFGGAILPRKMAVFVPLAAIIGTDLIIGLHDLVLVTWGVYVLIALASSKLLKHRSLGRGVVVALGASLFFFVVTNFAVWLTSGMYERTFAGLIQCFTLAVPFFRNTFASDMLYTSILFGVYFFALALSRHTVFSKEQL